MKGVPVLKNVTLTVLILTLWGCKDQARSGNESPQGGTKPEDGVSEAGGGICLPYCHPEHYWLWFEDADEPCKSFYTLGCPMQLINEVCGLDEAKRLMELGLCPPPDQSVIAEGERLVLGGDPEHKTTLPKGAQCPQGFEKLPRIVWPSESCWFQPTCWGVGVATRIPEPAILDGQYILSGLDAVYLADPLAGLADPVALQTYTENERAYEVGRGWEKGSLLNLDVRCEGTQEGSRCNGCLVFEDPWPTLAQHVYPPPVQEDDRMLVCAAKHGPWVDMNRREVVAQYNGLLARLIVKNFETASGCVIPRLFITTYCCGPILMLWPEDIQELRKTLVPACEEARQQAIEWYSNLCAEEPLNCDLLISFELSVVLPRVRGLKVLGNEVQPHKTMLPPNSIYGSCQLACIGPTCFDLANVSWFENLEYILSKKDEKKEFLKSIVAELSYSQSSEPPKISEFGPFELTLDKDGYPQTISRTRLLECNNPGLYCWPVEPYCTYDKVTVPYRTPEEVAADIARVP